MCLIVDSQQWTVQQALCSLITTACPDGTSQEWGFILLDFTFVARGTTSPPPRPPITNRSSDNRAILAHSIGVCDTSGLAWKGQYGNCHHNGHSLLHPYISILKPGFCSTHPCVTVPPASFSLSIFCTYGGREGREPTPKAEITGFLSLHPVG